VRDNGILILLGPATPASDKIHVGVNGFAACLGATWFAYVIERRGTGWVVTGTTGPGAIS